MFGNSSVEELISIIRVLLLFSGAIIAFYAAKSGLASKAFLTKIREEEKPEAKKIFEAKKISCQKHSRIVKKSLWWFLLGAFLFLISFFVPFIEPFVILYLGGK